MIIVVNDANILIDLIKLNLVVHFFELNWQFHTSSLIIENELYAHQVAILQPYIDNQKLTLQDFTAEEMEQIFEIQYQKPQLSDKDCSAFFCAQKLNAALITSDNNLRKFAKQKELEVHGHLWVFDALLAQNCITPITAIQKLEELNTVNPRLKLPKADMENRIKYWKNL